MTLVELAISLLLGAVLVSATVSSIMSTNKTNQLVEAQMQLQLNSVFALSVIEKAIRQAGYRSGKSVVDFEIEQAFRHSASAYDDAYTLRT